MVEVNHRTVGILISLQGVYEEIRLLVERTLTNERIRDYKLDIDSVFKNTVNSVMQHINSRTSQDSAYFHNCQSYFIEVGWTMEDAQSICSSLEVKTISEIFSIAPFLESNYARITKHIFLPSDSDILIFANI